MDMFPVNSYPEKIKVCPPEQEGIGFLVMHSWHKKCFLKFIIFRESDDENTANAVQKKVSFLILVLDYETVKSIVWRVSVNNGS